MRKIVIYFLLSGGLFFFLVKSGFSTDSKPQTLSPPAPATKIVPDKPISATSETTPPERRSHVKSSGLIVAGQGQPPARIEFSPVQQQINELARQHKETVQRGGDGSALEAHIRKLQTGIHQRSGTLDQGADVCPGVLINTPCLPYTITGTTVAMANNFNPSCIGSWAADVIYEYVPRYSGHHTISLCGSFFDTVLELRVGGSCPGSTLVICNDDFCSSQSLVEAELEEDNVYFIIIDGYAGNEGEYTMTISGPSGQWDDCYNPGWIVVPQSGTYSTCSFCNNLDYACQWASTSPDEVFTYTPLSDIRASISLCRSYYDTKLFVYDGSCSGIPVACNDDAAPCPCSAGSYRSFIECFQFLAGHTYYVVVDGYGGTCGQFVIETEECPPCVVSQQPTDIPEQEEDCTFNGINQNDPNSGCRDTPHRFWAMDDGEMTFGRLFTGWSFDSERDEDWYLLNLTQQASLLITVYTETDLVVGYGDSAGCSLTYSETIAAGCNPSYLWAACMHSGDVLYVGLPVEANVPIPRSYRIGYTAYPECCFDNVLYADAVLPVTYGGFTTGAGNDCPMQPSEDVVIQVVLPTYGWWSFDLCDSDFGTYLYVDTVCCGSHITAVNSCGLGSQQSFGCFSLPARTLYATIEGRNGQSGYYMLTVKRDDVAEQVTEVNASDTLCDGIRITWQDVSNDIGYMVLRNGVYAGDVPQDVTVFWDDIVSPGTYAYTIFAANLCAASISEPDSGTRIAPLPIVTGLTASDSSCEHVYLQWDNLAGETGYYIFRNDSPIDTVEKDVSLYIDSPFIEEYNYIVAGFNGCGMGIRSNPVQGGRYPSLWEPPVLLVPAEGALVYSGSPQLYSWEIIPTAGMYNIEWDDDEWFNTPITMSSPGTTVTTTLTGPDATWYWHVQGVNKCGSSPWNLTRSFQLVNISAPILVVIRNGPQLQLYWNRIPTATSYRVESAATSDGVYSFLTSTTDTSITTSFAGADRCFYQVIAVRE